MYCTTKYLQHNDVTAPIQNKAMRNATSSPGHPPKLCITTYGKMIPILPLNSSKNAVSSQSNSAHSISPTCSTVYTSPTLLISLHPPIMMSKILVFLAFSMAIVSLGSVEAGKRYHALF